MEKTSGYQLMIVFTVV